MAAVNVDAFTVASQADQLAKIRSLTPGLTVEVMDDDGLLRFFIARQGSVEKTVKMVTAHLAWRQKVKLDALPLFPDGPATFALRGFDFFLPDSQNSVNDPVFKALFENTGGFAVHKTDRLGNPVVIERAGFHDAVGVVKNVPIETAIDFHIRCNEFIFRRVMPALSKREGRVIGKVTVIMDCRGLGWQHFHLPALRYLLAFEQIDQDNYPERLARAFVVNAPAMFTTIWGVLKRGLDKRILDKVFIYGDKGYEEQLRKYIDPANLPEFLGGTCTCSHMPNGCVPCLQPERLAAMDRVQQYVGARDSFRLDIVVDEAGSALPYIFTTKDYNIQFGITYRASVEAEEETVVEPVQMRDSHVEPVEGRVAASKSGVYTFVWDNTHSYFKGKNVSYSVEVEAPERAHGAARTASAGSVEGDRSSAGSESGEPAASESAPL